MDRDVAFAGRYFTLLCASQCNGIRIWAQREENHQTDQQKAWRLCEFHIGEYWTLLNVSSICTGYEIKLLPDLG